MTGAPIAFLVLSLAVACIPPSAGQTFPAGDAVEARITNDEARFVFPIEADTVFSWHVPGQARYAGSPEYMWEVHWDPPPSRYGHDPDAFVASVRWRANDVRHGDLRALLATSTLSYDTFCIDCPGDMPLSIVKSDAALSVRAESNRVILRVAGRAAVRRMFPTIPDSVRLLHYSPAGWPDREWVAAVHRP